MKLTSHLIRSAKTVWMRTRLGLLVVWAILMIGIVPLPCREHGTGWVQPARMQGLYAPQTARLTQVSHFPGTRVQQDDIIFKLDDDAAQIRQIDLKGHARRAEVQLVSLSQQVKRNLPVDVDLRSAENTVQALTNQVQLAAEAASKLNVKADMDGKLISLAAPKLHDVDGRTIEPAPQLWLDTDQCGRVVSQGTMLAAVCSRQQLAIVPLSDAQLRDVCEGTAVRFYLPSHSDRVWQGLVRSIVKLEQLDSLARLVVATATQADATGNPLSSAEGNRAGYAAVIDMPMQDASIGCEVKAVFTVPAKTLASRTNDWLHSNLRWLIQ